MKLKHILKFTRALHKKAVGLHIAALRAGVSAQRKYAAKLLADALEASAAEREAKRRAEMAHRVAARAAKHEEHVQAAAKDEAELIGGKL